MTPQKLGGKQRNLVVIMTMIPSESQRVMKFLDESTPKVDGRYEVPFIWRDDKVELPDNFATAAQRLNFLEKLNCNPELAER